MSINERVAERYLKLSDAAQTILKQLGGNRLFAMLGAQVIRKTPNSITFKWPNKRRSRGNVCTVELRPDDTYDMTFFNASGSGTKKVKEYQGVYADQLVDTFERQTGWYLRLAGEVEIPEFDVRQIVRDRIKAG